MIPIAFEYELKFQLPLSQDETRKYFSEIENIGTNTVDVVEFKKIDNGTASWLLKEANEFGICFQPCYVLTYSWPEVFSLHWKTVSGNTEIDALLTFNKIDSNTTEVLIKESVSFDLSISKIMAKIVKTMAARETKQGMKEFFKNVLVDMENKRLAGQSACPA